MIDFFALGLVVPDGSIVGVIETGERTLAAPGLIRVGPGEEVPSARGNYFLDHTFSAMDAVRKALAVSRLLDMRRAGSAFLLASHDETLLANCADELWWLASGKLMGRGDPPAVLDDYRRHVAAAIRAAGAGRVAAVSPALRDGDGRATLESIELLDGSGAASIVWQSGEQATIRVTVRFHADIAEPVVGILVRTRIGLNAYGTNTELEKLSLGPVKAGEVVRVTYSFACELCPGDYTVTAASHDPDGVWHDWLEDAVAFAVADTRYTAGVANLRARVMAERVCS